MTKSISETLYAAADLLEGEGRWTQGEYARSAKGRKVVTVKSAVCFCALGAINAASGMKNVNSDCFTVQRYFEQFVPEHDTPYWNDAPNRTQSEVVAKLREAGDRAREEGK